MNNSLKRNWYWFLLGIIGASALVCGGIAIRTSPTTKEKILFYVSALKVDTSSLVKECKDVTDENIRQIRINHESVLASENSRLFGMVYDSTDIYIYPEFQLERTLPLSIHFNEETIDRFIPNALGKDLSADENGYAAIKIYDCNSGEGILKSIIDYHIDDTNQQNYYLSFFKSSKHIGGLNSSSSNNAIKIVNHLLEL